MLNKEYYKNTPLCEIIKKLPCAMDTYGFEQWLNSEHTILDEQEKNYLRNLVLPFYDKVKHVVKASNSDSTRCFIRIKLNNYESVELPYFDKNKMYCGMEEFNYYTLKELGIFK